mmetsp:Transcript_13141/g.52446  ORF Transcript_13141/g.52446 Transcript_13141/m.52446 type:complete len:340 (-) Transcript_13141:1757-2776(-)
MLACAGASCLAEYLLQWPLGNSPALPLIHATIAFGSSRCTRVRELCIVFSCLKVEVVFVVVHHGQGTELGGRRHGRHHGGVGLVVEVVVEQRLAALAHHLVHLVLVRAARQAGGQDLGHHRAHLRARLEDADEDNEGGDDDDEEAEDDAGHDGHPVVAVVLAIAVAVVGAAAGGRGIGHGAGGRQRRAVDRGRLRRHWGGRRRDACRRVRAGHPHGVQLHAALADVALHLAVALRAEPLSLAVLRLLPRVVRRALADVRAHRRVPEVLLREAVAVADVVVPPAEAGADDLLGLLDDVVEALDITLAAGELSPRAQQTAATDRGRELLEVFGAAGAGDVV